MTHLAQALCPKSYETNLVLTRMLQGEEIDSIGDPMDFSHDYTHLCHGRSARIMDIEQRMRQTLFCGSP